jgi:hypothetical protein
VVVEGVVVECMVVEGVVVECMVVEGVVVEGEYPPIGGIGEALMVPKVLDA